MNETINVIQTAYSHFANQDIPALLEMLAPDVRWQFHGDQAAPYTESVIGPAQVGAWFAKVAAADDIQEFAPREFFAGTDHVTVIGHCRTIARHSGGEFSSPFVHVFEVSDGRITRFLGIVDSEVAGKARAGAA